MGGICLVATTGLEGCNTSFHPGNQFGGCSLLVGSSSVIFAVASSTGELVGALVGHSWEQLPLIVWSRIPLGGPHAAEDGFVREGDVMFHFLPQFHDTPCQKAWLALSRQIGFFCPKLEGLGIGHCLLQL